jgi:L-iditol 2-dehydrogenase
MKAAVFRGPGRLAVEDWPRPAAGPGEILLALSGCGLCGSDIAKLVDPGTRTPAVFGHEVVGTVAEVGAGVTDLAAGDRVVAAHHVPCGDCHYCRRGSESMCRAFKASNLDPGGFAEFVRVPAPNVRHATFRLPPGLSDEAASFVEPLACCIRAVTRARVQPGDTAVVVGLGSIGCLFVQLLRRAGVVVIGCDPVARRADLALALGAAAAGSLAVAGAAARSLSEGRGVDHVVVTGGAPAVLAPAAGFVRDGGALHVFAGGPGDNLPLALDTLYHRELVLTTTYSSSPAALGTAFRLIAAGEIQTARLLTHHLPLARLGEAVELMRRREALKVLITP